MPDTKKRRQLLEGLKSLLDAQYILSTQEQLKPFECDGLSVYRELPLVAVLPGSTAEVQAIIMLCHDLAVPLVTRGAGTGLSAGARPHPEGLLLVLTRLSKILDINPKTMTARLEPGVRNLAISEAAAEHCLFYAPDPSSQIACSIGGNIAENAGGVHCLKYGLTVHNILRLKGFSMTGEEVVIGAEGLDSAGFNLQSLIIGSEGMLMVITEITVNLLPKPQHTEVLLAAFDDIATAGQAVSNIIAAGLIPAGLEMMDNNAICAAEDYAHAGYPRDAAAILLIEIDGSTTNVEEQLKIMREVLNNSGLTALKIARDDNERALFWKGRKSAFPAVGRISPDYYCMDGTIPRKALPEVLGFITALSDEYGFLVANVFHAGDGNLHPLILFDANVPGQLESVEEMGGRILEKCIEVGGTITGEHGVGLEKIRQMPLQFTDLEISQFHAVKMAFDPDDLLNPGKNIPMLKHCQEYRALSRNLEPNRLLTQHKTVE
ncbi:MAG: FAD-linked oxidase C-terminal domain-containing protein [Gammaproteobacteria bacterium]|nr:FAD-linked oxidase C-terminal domain-containing protein [Gammaproteobacteria bacterium]